MRPFASIIIPCYNPPVSAFEAMLKSLEKLQEKEKVQIILICTSSDQAVIEKCRSISNPAVEILFESDQGVCHSRNLGINAAKGDWILFLDSDDTLKPDTISVLMEELEPETDLAFFGFDKIRSGEAETILFEKDEPENMAILQNGGGLCWNKAYKRKFLIQNHLYFDESLRLAEDLEFVLRVIACHPVIQVIELPLYEYHIHSSSASQRFRKDMAEEYRKSMLKIDSTGLDEDLKNTAILDHLIFTVLKHTLRSENGSRKEQAESLKKLLKKEPYTKLLKNRPKKLSKKQAIFFSLLKNRNWPMLQAAAWLYGRRRT